MRKKRLGRSRSTERLKSAGTSLREVKSPEAPKITITVGGMERFPEFVIKKRVPYKLQRIMERGKRFRDGKAGYLLHQGRSRSHQIDKKSGGAGIIFR